MKKTFKICFKYQSSSSLSKDLFKSDKHKNDKCVALSNLSIFCTWEL